MKRIPDAMREEMDADPFMHRCCMTGLQSTYGDPVQWHHAIIYGGSQLNEPWAIVPVLKSVHQALEGDTELRERVELVALNRATDDDLRRISKVVDYRRRRDNLNQKYGNS